MFCLCQKPSSPDKIMVVVGNNTGCEGLWDYQKNENSLTMFGGFCQSLVSDFVTDVIPFQTVLEQSRTSIKLDSLFIWVCSLVACSSYSSPDYLVSVEAFSTRFLAC